MAASLAARSVGSSAPSVSRCATPSSVWKKYLAIPLQRYAVPRVSVGIKWHDREGAASSLDALVVSRRKASSAQSGGVVEDGTMIDERGVDDWIRNIRRRDSTLLEQEETALRSVLTPWKERLPEGAVKRAVESALNPHGGA